MLFPHFITPNFSAAIDKHFPLTKENKSYRAFIMYCAFGGWKVYDWIGLDVSRVACSILEEKPLDQHYAAMTFLADLKANLLPSLQISNWIPEKQARSITGLDFGAFQAEIEKEREALSKATLSDLVHWHTGAKHHRSIVKAERDTEKERHYMISKRTSERQKKFQDYLNNLPSNTFAGLVNENFDAAWKQWQEMPFADEQTKHITGSALLGIKQSPMPLYFTPGTNERLFTTGVSLASIKRELRQTLTRGCVEFDFANCHWAIMARMLEIQSLSSVLESGDTVWSALGVSGDTKRQVKECLTPLLFGQKDYIAKGYLPAHIPTEHRTVPREKFFATPFVQDTIEAVNKALYKIVVEQDCTSAQAKSKLFDMVSRVELELMEPFVDYSLAHMDECYMLIYQYDGCTFTFRKNKEHHIKTITELVNSNARELGYMTFVEPKELIG